MDMTDQADIAAIRVALQKLVLAAEQARLIDDFAANGDTQQALHRLDALTHMLSDAYPTAAEAISALDRIAD